MERETQICHVNSDGDIECRSEADVPHGFNDFNFTHQVVTENKRGDVRYIHCHSKKEAEIVAEGLKKIAKERKNDPLFLGYREVKIESIKKSCGCQNKEL